MGSLIADRKPPSQLPGLTIDQVSSTERPRRPRQISVPVQRAGLQPFDRSRRVHPPSVDRCSVSSRIRSEFGCWGSVFVGGRHTASWMRSIRGSSCPGRAAHRAGWRLSPTVMRVASCTSGHCQPQGFGQSSRRIAGDARPASLLAESHAADRAHAGRWSAPGAVAGRFQGLLEGCTKWGIRIRSSRPDLHVTSAEGIRIGHP